MVDGVAVGVVLEIKIHPDRLDEVSLHLEEAGFDRHLNRAGLAKLFEELDEVALIFRSLCDDKLTGKLAQRADRPAVVLPAFRGDGVFDQLDDGIDEVLARDGLNGCLRRAGRRKVLLAAQQALEFALLDRRGAVVAPLHLL